MKKEALDYIEKIYREKEFVLDPTGYFYDLLDVQNNIKILEKNLPAQIKLYYAMKANSNNAILKSVREMDYVEGLEIASAGELCKALQYYEGKRIIYTGPGKTEYELEQAIENEIRLINVESVVEAHRINNITKCLGKKPTDILLRINLNCFVSDSQENMSGYSTKMGIDEDEYIESFRIISELEYVNVKGIHAFAASGILNYKSLINVNDYIFKFVAKLQKEVGEISIIDFGGGLGIDYTDKNCKFDIVEYGKALKKLIKESGAENKEILMELGTFIVGNAGYYTAKIVDIKTIKRKKHIIIAGGINHMGLPLEMKRKHPVRIISMNEQELYLGQPMVKGEIVDISGPLCIVSDKLAWDEYIEKARIGDIVVFSQAGAYCYGEGMQEFLMHMKPKEWTFENCREKCNIIL